MAPSFLNSEESYNYVELVLVNERTEERVFNIDFTDTQCTNILNHVVSCYPECKVFKKHTTKYMYDMLEQTVCENDISLHHMSLVDHRILDQGTKRQMLLNYYNRALLSNQSFPSTSAVVDVIDSKRVTVKINHSVYMNFDSMQYMSDNSLATHIYINVNIGKSSDIEHVSSVCDKLVQTIQSSFV